MDEEKIVAFTAKERNLSKEKRLEDGSFSVTYHNFNEKEEEPSDEEKVVLERTSRLFLMTNVIQMLEDEKLMNKWKLKAGICESGDVEEYLAFMELIAKDPLQYRKVCNIFLEFMRDEEFIKRLKYVELDGNFY